VKKDSALISLPVPSTGAVVKPLPSRTWGFHWASSSLSHCS